MAAGTVELKSVFPDNKGKFLQLLGLQNSCMKTPGLFLHQTNQCLVFKHGHAMHWQTPLNIPVNIKAICIQYLKFLYFYNKSTFSYVSG